MMKTIAGWMVTGLLLIGCGGEPSQAIEVTEQDEQTVALDGRTLVIEGFNGNVAVVGRRDSVAVLQFEKKATGIDEEEAGQHLAGINVTTREGRDATTVRVQSEHGATTSVNVRAQVPYNLPLRVHLDNGTIGVEAVSGPVTAAVENGSVTVKGAANDLDVQIGTGDLSVDMVGFRTETQVALRANNGSITLILPPSTSATVEAETEVGPLDVSGLALAEASEAHTVTGGRVEGTLGDGSGHVVVQTVNGAVTLRGGQ